METQSNIFVPKYPFVFYLKPLVFVGGFIYLLIFIFWMGTRDWVSVFIVVLWGIVSFLNVKNIVKQIEFGYQSMVVHFYILADKEIEYQDIEDIDVNSSIKMKGLRIELMGMSNRMDLQKKVAAILLDKKILEINVDERISQKKRAVIKIFKYAAISTVTIGGVASLLVHADLAIWAILFFILFSMAVQILSIFIKK